MGLIVKTDDNCGPRQITIEEVPDSIETHFEKNDI